MTPRLFTLPLSLKFLYLTNLQRNGRDMGFHYPLRRFRNSFFITLAPNIDLSYRAYNECLIVGYTADWKIIRRGWDYSHLRTSVRSRPESTSRYFWPILIPSPVTNLGPTKVRHNLKLENPSDCLAFICTSEICKELSIKLKNGILYCKINC